MAVIKSKGNKLLILLINSVETLVCLSVEYDLLLEYNSLLNLEPISTNPRLNLPPSFILRLNYVP